MSIRNTGSASASEHAGREREAEHRAAQDATHDRAPEAPFGVRGLERAPPDDRDAERVDPVAEEPEHGRQQRQRRDHRDDPDEDRPDGEAAHDRVRDEQHPEHRDDEHACR